MQPGLTADAYYNIIIAAGIVAEPKVFKDKLKLLVLYGKIKLEGKQTHWADTTIQVI